MSENKNDVAVKEVPDIKLREYISYGLSNSGGTVVFSCMASLITIFWTDYTGVDAAIIAQVIAISKIFDAISNLVFGYWIQETKTRWGQARPWILYMSIPFSASAVLCFLCPADGTPRQQWWFIFIAYNFISTICYTAMDLAEGTLCSLLTEDPKQREKFGAFRLGLCTIGHILAGGLTFPLIHLMGNDQKSWIIVLVIWAIYAAVVHLNCFFQCKERVVHVEEAYVNRPPIGQQLKALMVNKYWWWAFLYWGVWATQFAFAGTMMTYWCRYFLLNDNLYSVFFILEKIVWGFMNLFGPQIRDALGWTIRRMFVVGSLVAGCAHLMLLVWPLSIPVNVILCALRGLGVGCLSSYFNGVISVVTDYGQLITHQRQESLVFAAASMGEKIFNGIILAIMTGLLAWAGFESSTTGGTAQSEQAMNMIKNLYIYGDLIVYGSLAIITSFYKLDGREYEIQEELKARAAKGEL